MDIKISTLQHIGIPVTNIKKSIAFYGRLGFSPAMTAKFPYAGGNGDVTMMRQENIIIELYQYPDPERHAIGKRGNGHIDHITFDVPDIDQAFSVLKAAGHNLLEDAPVFLPFWENGCKYFNITGPDGERLEFNQIL